jgi:hypothetical protein
MIIATHKKRQKWSGCITQLNEQRSWKQIENIFKNPFQFISGNLVAVPGGKGLQAPSKLLAFFA